MKKEVSLGVTLSLLIACWAQGAVYISPTTDRNDAVAGPYVTIQEALDVARDAVRDLWQDETLQDIVDADYILVDALGSPYKGDGNRDLQMWVPKRLLAVDVNSVRAEIGDVVIDCNGLARGFLFLEGQNYADPNEPEDVNEGFIVDGFTIINGFASEATDLPDITNVGCGGGMLIDAGSPVIANCMFFNCVAYDFAGGGIAIGQGEGGGGGGDNDALIRSCIFYSNSAYYAGGGVAVRDEATPNFINCLMLGNYADSGGNIYAESSTPNFELCTVVYGSGYYDVYCDDASPTFVNCILWSGGIGYSGSIDLTNCIIDDVAIDGDNVSYDDPMFLQGPYNAIWGPPGNYYLDPASPAVDAGAGTLANPYARDYGMNVRRYTDPAGNPDRLQVDLGFHYPQYTGPDIPVTLTIVVDSVPANGRVRVNGMYDPNNIYEFVAGDWVWLDADPNVGYRVEYWIGTNDDTIYDLDNLSRYLYMYESREVHVSFEPDVPKTLNYPGQYADLQYAVKVARDGDTIIVHPGVYVLPGYGAYKPPRYAVVGAPCITITNKAITIRSVAPTDPATVASTAFEAGWGVSTVFRLEDCGRDTIVSGITIRNSNLREADGLNGTSDNPVHPAGNDGGSGYGAGMQIAGYGWGWGPTVSNCVFENLSKTGGNGGNAIAMNNLGYDGGHGGCAGGGAVFVDYADALFQNCTFDNCFAQAGNGGNGVEATNRYGRGGSYKVWSSTSGGDGERIERQAGGGAVMVLGGSAEFEDCTFTNCYTSSGRSGIGSSPYEIGYDMGSSGGAVYVGGNFMLGWPAGSASFTRCTFSNNAPRLVADPLYRFESPYIAYGGAIATDENGSITLTDCTFTGNTASVGGALYWAGRITSTNMMLLEGNTFEQNGAFQGGAIYGYRGAAWLLENTFRQNTASFAAGGGEPLLSEGLLNQGGAIYLASVSALVGDSVFRENESTHSGGALAVVGFNQVGQEVPRVHNCLFLENKADRDGGAVVCTDNSEPNIVNCTMVANEATGSGSFIGSGGAMSVTAGSSTTIENCLLWGNTAFVGPQLSLVDPNGLGVYQYAYATVRYSMLQNGQVNIATAPGSYLMYESNNVEGYASPQFVYDYVTQTDNFITKYSLTNTSPCIDKGRVDLDTPDPNKQPLLPLGRYVYTLRTDGQRDTGIIDIGYHRRKAGYYPQGDINYSGAVTILDLAALAEYYLADTCRFPDWCEGADLNKNGAVNLVDEAILSHSYGAGDITAPIPDPARWLIPPTANSTTSITMTAVTAVDNSGNAVEYLFECVSAGGHSSAWSTSSTYTDTGLTTGSEYGYRVKARDVIPEDPNRHNETDWSSTLYGYAGEDGRAPSPNPAQWATPPYATSPASIAMTAMTGVDASGVEYYFRCESGAAGYDSGWQASPSFINTELYPDTIYTYTVKMRDKSAAANTGGLSSPASAKTFTLPDTTPPIPNPAQWLIQPYAVSTTEIIMAAVQAYDVSGVEYNFECILGGHDKDSGWQQTLYYTATDLEPATMYTFVLHVRDMSANRNECTPATAVSAYTLGEGGLPGAGIPPYPSPMQWTVDSAWGGADVGYPTQVIAYEVDEFITTPPGYYHVMTAAWAYDYLGSTLGVQYYFECVTYPRLSSGWIDPLYFNDTGVFYYARVGDLGWPQRYVWRVKARDMWNTETAWSPAVMAGN